MVMLIAIIFSLKS